MKKTDVLITLALFLLIAILITFSIARKPEVTGTETATVYAGDTLWDISGEYCPPEIRRSEWIYEVKKMNGITAGNPLSPGEIEVIVYE